MMTITARLRGTPNWMRQDYGDWKHACSHYDRAPFEAADVIEELIAALNKIASADPVRPGDDPFYVDEYSRDIARAALAKVLP